MNRQKEEKIIQERAMLGSSFRSLGLKYGVSHSRIYRMVNKSKVIRENKEAEAGAAELPDDVKLLQALLRKERLKTELLNNMIDIAGKELGIDIRKKSGTRQSE